MSVPSKHGFGFHFFIQIPGLRTEHKNRRASGVSLLKMTTETLMEPTPLLQEGVCVCVLQMYALCGIVPVLLSASSTNTRLTHDPFQERCVRTVNFPCCHRPPQSILSFTVHAVISLSSGGRTGSASSHQDPGCEYGSVSQIL